MKEFKGKVLFLDRSDINTDEIIPAKYLTEIEKIAMGPHLLEDLKMDGFDPKTDIQGKSVVLTQGNFGCGSSREHAPWALEVNGIHVVIAPSFARIFRQNMYNCGMLAIELPQKTVDDLFKEFAGNDTVIAVDVKAGQITVQAGAKTKDIGFEISGFDKELVQTGGWVEYADQNY
ncbi:MAG: 3-isopropylmalate dehydratase small subunit [Proteobacteria bacterium]|nr:3-isopropylmalate dehydratase small subunit [Pseudomonadota bacterium]MBU1388345.1 3-isopropylmalate dehydratase small subunit [Pseudomonadota bacterium]MBU1542831.1 3-isopropylmalate dehydratase small subunit [Pseudomonadota bacterium]MBU2430840.1 3-isopropylmalate dehydratase small subunit [Pseudomonadota bacterium]MBU2482950.1 3-isopropylmalate dehydratase small subunit [Pseudomonadota bacterium]